MMKATHDPSTTTTPPIPSRRVLLTGASAALLAGAAAVTAASAAPAVPDGAAGADAELIRLCNRMVELEAARRTLIDSETQEDEAQPELDGLYAESEAVFDRVCELPDPVTHAGALALARAALAEAPRELNGEIAWEGRAEWFAFGAAEFLVGEQDRQGRGVA
jgi:hypothetical protein